MTIPVTFQTKLDQLSVNYLQLSCNILHIVKKVLLADVCSEGNEVLFDA